MEGTVEDVREALKQYHVRLQNDDLLEDCEH